MERPQEQPPDEFDVGLADVAVTGAPDAFGESFAALPERSEFELGEGLEGDPAIAFRRTLGMFATGVTILTTRVGEQIHGMTANAFMSVSLRPPLVLVSIDRRTRMYGILHEGRRFGVNVLEAHQAGLSDRFAGRTGEDLAEPRFRIVRDTPLVDGALAHLVARVVRSYWGGDHSLFLGHVEYAHHGVGRPLLFHGGRYERVLGYAPVFSALPGDVLDRLLQAGEERAFADRDIIVRVGEPGDELFVVLEGTARVERDGSTITELAARDVFGEVSVLDGGPRTADVVAVGPVRCLAVPRDALRDALEAVPGAAWQLLEVLAQRFRHQA